MRTVLQLILAVLVSGIVHWWVLRPGHRETEAVPSAAAAVQAMQLQVQMVEAQEEPAPPPPPPVPEKAVDEPVPEEDPVRLSSNDPELEENDGAPPPTAPAEPEKAQEEPQEDLQEPDLEPTPETDVASETVVEDEPVEQPEEQVEEDVAQDVATVVEKLSKARKQTLKTGMSDSEYRRFLASLKIGRVKGRAMPRLIQAFADVREIQEVHRYYGMKVIAVDPAHANHVVEVTGFGSGEIGFQKIDDFQWANFSNRVYPRTAPFFRSVAQKLQSAGYFSDGTFRLVSIVPNAVDNYFVYKQSEAVRRAGLTSDQVRSTVARFHKTDFGGWILAVERLELMDGTVKTVKDFELEKLAK